MRTRLIVPILALFTSLAFAAPASAMTAIAVTDTVPQNVLRFDTAAPTTITSTIALTGLGTNERSVGIDWNQKTGKLVLLSRNTADNTGRLYSLDPFTGVASSPLLLDATVPASNNFDIDVNPLTSVVYISSDTSYLSANSTTGVVAPAVSFSGASIGAGLAFSNNYASAVSTNLYAYDTNADRLGQVTIADGTFTAIGFSGQFVNTFRSGLDVYSDPVPVTNTMYALFNIGGVNNLYTVNIATGAPTLLGTIGNGATGVADFAILPTVVKLEATSVAAVEGSTAAVHLKRENAAQSATVKWTAAAGTAGATEFAGSGTATFGPGESTVVVPIAVNEDTLDESSETFTVTFTGDPLGASQLGVPLVGPTSTATVTIGDNDVTVIPPVVPTPDTTKPFVFLVQPAGMKLALFSKRGLTMLATTSEASTGKVELLLGTKVIATGNVASKSAALITKNVKATKAGKKLLAAKKGKRIALVARVTLKDAAGNTTVAKRSFALSR